MAPGSVPSLRSAPAASESAPRGGRYFLGRLIRDAIFFGLIALLFGSWFPVALGAFFFFAEDEFITWALEKVGIRLVPGTLGPPLVNGLVWVTGAAALLVCWKDSAPAWLAPWLPSGNPPPWPLIDGIIVAVAFAGAALTFTVTKVAKSLFPRFGIRIDPDLAGDIVGLLVFGGIFLFFLISNWF